MVESGFKGSIETHTPYAIDHRIILPDGSVKYVQERGKIQYTPAGVPVRSSGTVLDITDRKLAELALKKEERKMRAMLEASYDAYVMIDDKETILFWSPAVEKIFG